MKFSRSQPIAPRRNVRAKTGVGLAGGLAAIWLMGCVAPMPPLYLGGEFGREVSMLDSELVVIGDGGLLDPDSRILHPRGAIAFLNEATTGPVTIRIAGDFNHLRADHPGLVRMAPAEHGLATPDPLPAGAVAVAPIATPGLYVYEVQVGKRVFVERFAVRESASVATGGTVNGMGNAMKEE